MKNPRKNKKTIIITLLTLIGIFLIGCTTTSREQINPKKQCEEKEDGAPCTYNGDGEILVEKGFCYFGKCLIANEYNKKITDNQRGISKEYNLSALKGENVDGIVTILAIDLIIYQNDTVAEGKVIKKLGRTTKYFGRRGSHLLVIVNRENNILWNEGLEIYFDYTGPVYAGVDYPDVNLISFPLNPSIPYKEEMYKLMLFKVTYGEEISYKLIYSKILDFCNRNGICDVTEYYGTCKEDCPLDKKDNFCMPNEGENICDPDCAEGVDKDC